MPQLVVTAKRLNRRKVIPTVLPDPNNIAGEVFLNDTFEAEEAVAPNTTLGKWYKDRDGFFYWGGGVKESTLFTLPSISEEIGMPRVEVAKINWRNNFIGLTDELKTHTGKSVKVAVIDTGVDIFHPAISANIESPKDFTQSNNPMTDEAGHGSAIAGIIAANPGDEKTIIGIAPGCKIIPIKVMNSSFDKVQLEKNILNALQYAIDMKADIINISQDLGNNIPQALKDIMNTAAEKGIVLIASAGDIDELTEIGVTFPGSDPNFISIGASNKAFIQGIINKHPQRLDFLGGFKMFPTLSGGPEKYTTVIGSSFCAAFLSGACALIISKLKAEGKTTGRFPRQNIMDHLSTLISAEEDLYKENFFSFIKI